MTFRKRLKNLRENSGFTQTDVAKALNINYKTISNYELGKREPDLKTLIEICDLFDVTADYLLGRTAHPHYYKQIALDVKSESLLNQFSTLPNKSKDDIIRFVSLNVLEMVYEKNKK
jgi:transcriptional regulator with XRE-family HTH domain